MCSIIDAETNEYIGHCGIKNISSERWEIAIELLEAVAEKFGVEPRSLLSHVLEYKLIWERK